ncbi:LysE family transporter [Thermopolyspora sp. NPDC052614]|uniref:LysE family translocator n=1 Tax=Thermopolyspora sp. NPDC052614 TaxID=3155682 RepID=UPI00341FBBC7
MRELLLGISLGFGAGLSPGPLLSLVIAASLRGGFAAGLRIACVPLLSDLPVVLLTTTAVGALPAAFVAALSLAGGLYVVHLGVSTIRDARQAERPAGGGEPPSGARELLHGVVINMLNPHAWLFWIAVGAPAFVAAWGRTPAIALAFLFGFYLVLVGSKAVLAGLIGAGRHRLGRRAYRLLLGGSGALLLVAGGALAVQGVGGLLDVMG